MKTAHYYANQIEKIVWIVGVEEAREWTNEKWCEMLKVPESRMDVVVLALKLYTAKCFDETNGC